MAYYTYSPTSSYYMPTHSWTATSYLPGYGYKSSYYYGSGYSSGGSSFYGSGYYSGSYSPVFVTPGPYGSAYSGSAGYS